ncbi:trypsin-like peptidase domain-containing protein [Sulfitobacter guttiformis]|uniref:Putative peptidoglycan binding protein n=1 Tax=Sulfitobacter guttiformis TaxID=74349 RepID=A0A420DJK9_9RHOB|nr:trypsin-like peptidase domain-containing protein [Sulfitobacter guttiformis]KIN71754.1 Peptidoglycan binding domain protein [Sulfitobacter guttiformis KCTC 32187]RKE94426.1 putative peptidoglycan binding protein [Sulfitobacter guttiformis]
MLRLFTICLTALFLCISGGVNAQSVDPDEVVWVQIEAQQSLARATDRARAYTTLLDDVNGFAVGGGWYAIVVGPYRRADADVVLAQYRREGIIPNDSFIQRSVRLRQQFWPVGVNILGGNALDAPDSPLSTPEPDLPPAPLTAQETPEVAQVAPLPDPEPVPDTETLSEPQPQQADETPTEAQRIERDLTPEAKKQLQVMLQWAGFYDAAIDGSFGRGTRNSMAAWQEANNYEKTGILTTLQRAALKKQYNAVLEGLGLETVRDAQAGIEITLPMGVVAFDSYEPPFAQYTPTGDVQARVLLISQPGTQDTLFGLYEIMQTLEIVPLSGPRERNETDFTLVGENGLMISYTEAALVNGEIKGFTLIWPAGDEERRRRLLAEMRASFIRMPGVLSASAGDASQQSIDLISGLQIRKPKISRSGFFITAAGDVATTSATVQSCSRITLDGDTDAELLVNDTARGVALLRPKVALAPLAVATFASKPARLQSDVTVAGYSFEGVLSSPSISFGTLADVRGLQGEENISRLALRARTGDAGGPVLDRTGAVIGMITTQPTGDTVLPDDVSFALSSATVVAVSTGAGLSLPPTAQDGLPGLTEFQLAEKASGMTVLVSCWE